MLLLDPLTAKETNMVPLEVGSLSSSEIEATITLNYRRLNEARDNGEPVLAELFEQRLNNQLDVYSDFLRFSLGSAGVSS